MPHAVHRHVVQKGGAAEDFLDKIGARQVLPDDAVFVRALDRGAAARLARQID
jgi:hypothetical protein